MHQPKTRMAISDDKELLLFSNQQCCKISGSHSTMSAVERDWFTGQGRCAAVVRQLYCMWVEIRPTCQHISEDITKMYQSPELGRNQMAGVKKCIPAAFKQPLDLRADRIKVITTTTGNFVSSAMQHICSSRGAWHQVFIKSAQALFVSQFYKARDAFQCCSWLWPNAFCFISALYQNRAYINRA